MEPTISVIVITYNQEKTIGRTLDSILMQQCHVPFEIVIGEDCSTDGTLAVCQQYAKKRPDTIRILANNPNKGIVDNYFDCILACRGKYIADCAGDDFWIDPLKLEKEIGVFEQHPDVTLVHTDWQYYNDTTGIVSPSPQKPFTAPVTCGKDMLEAIVTQTSLPVIHLCTSLYKADVIKNALAHDETMFRNKEYGCEDLQIAFAMAQEGNIAFLPDITLNYSHGHESASSSVHSEKLYRNTKRFTELSFQLAQRYDIHSEKTEAYFSQRIFALGMHAFRLHEPSLLSETMELEKRWKVQRSNKTRLLFAVMRHDVLWSCGLRLRQAFVTVKKLFR